IPDAPATGGTVVTVPPALSMEKPEQANPLFPERASPPSPPPPVENPGEKNQRELLSKLTAFVYEHHAKSSRKDIDGLVADFAGSAEYFDHGVVDRQFIRKTEIAERKPG